MRRILIPSKISPDNLVPIWVHKLISKLKFEFPIGDKIIISFNTIFAHSIALPLSALWLQPCPPLEYRKESIKRVSHWKYWKNITKFKVKLLLQLGCNIELCNKNFAVSLFSVLQVWIRIFPDPYFLAFRVVFFSYGNHVEAKIFILILI